ncbi:universal stress protein [Streptomyces sp. NPDC048415]|uniref:universal stress protein n=1 Tax=Streptomyces sp. NPDC048415 TaxID=3154822 RepID=UPI00342800C9
MSSEVSPPLIVVGVDGSESSRAALRWAARQAGLTGAESRPMQAWRLPAIYGAAGLLRRRLRETGASELAAHRRGDVPICLATGCACGSGVGWPFCCLQ